MHQVHDPPSKARNDFKCRTSWGQRGLGSIKRCCGSSLGTAAADSLGSSTGGDQLQSGFLRFSSLGMLGWNSGTINDLSSFNVLWPKVLYPICLLTQLHERPILWVSSVRKEVEINESCYHARQMIFAGKHRINQNFSVVKDTFATLARHFLMAFFWQVLVVAFMHWLKEANVSSRKFSFGICWSVSVDLECLCDAFSSRIFPNMDSSLTQRIFAQVTEAFWLLLAEALGQLVRAVPWTETTLWIDIWLFDEKNWVLGEINISQRI